MPQLEPIAPALKALLPRLPLYERLQVLADAMGEELSPAVYVETGDGGAQRQVVNVTPSPSEGPFVIHDLAFPATGTAAQIALNLNANGMDYTPNAGVRIDALPTAMDAPIVVRAGNKLTAALVAGSGAHGTIIGYASGVHCSERFARAVRALGELWAEQRTFSTTTPAQQTIQVNRPTELQALLMPTTGQTITDLWIKHNDRWITPRPLGAEPALWQPARGFSRGTVSSSNTPRLRRTLKRGDELRFKVTTSGTVVFVALGAQVYAS